MDSIPQVPLIKLDTILLLDRHQLLPEIDLSVVCLLPVDVPNECIKIGFAHGERPISSLPRNEDNGGDCAFSHLDEEVFNSSTRAAIVIIRPNPTAR